MHELLVIIAFVLYLGIMMAIGVYYSKKNNSMYDYVLGGRRLGPWATALSAEAADMSGWMMLGLPGAAYLSGLVSGWIAVGLGLGTWANWHFVAKRLRRFSENRNNAMTIPNFLMERYQDQSNILRIVPAIFIIVFFVLYAASAFVSGGKLFSTVFGLSYESAVLISVVVVVFYTILGGFLAVVTTECIQGLMMFFAILIVPVIASFTMGGPAITYEAVDLVSPTFWQPFTENTGETITAIGLISLLAWGFGYFGQPHILTRFMAIRNEDELRRGKYIAMTWFIISMIAAVMVGIVGKVFLTTPLTGADVEKVLLVMTEELFSPFVVGLIMSAVLAAIMSTASGQLLVAASSLAQDIYRILVKKDATEQHLLTINRLSVLIISLLALYFALDENSYILDMVAYAWAGFGASFGPAILFSVYYKYTTRNAVIAGIVTGGVTVIVWKQLALLGLYEIVPGFILSSLVIYIVSKLDKKPSQAIIDQFEKDSQNI